MENTLYYGDNLDILCEHIPDQSIDLVCLDPPFKSNQNYNILFKERNGAKSAAQIRTFQNTWILRRRVIIFRLWWSCRILDPQKEKTNEYRNSMVFQAFLCAYLA